MNHNLTPCIALNGVRVNMGARCILEVPSLHIQPGEKVAVLGRNGAGKSTLLRCLNGFVRPAEGSIQVNNLTVCPIRRERDLRIVRAQVGQVLQGLHLVGRLTALENVLVGGLASMPLLRSWVRLFTPAETERAQAALSAVGMLGLASKRADQLSGGERQKVAIARMLMQQPRLVLADEPTAALDPTASEEVCQLLLQCAQQATLLTVVHNTKLVPLLSQRVIGLKAGRIVLDCPSHELSQEHLDFLYE
ncbi:phosphonate ABC transporter ATP-binding protein [Limnobacter sp.]|uniref:phosphonate ABC transporter ATP-binding protein n=1 Tax=Limnobacter sp. TaxID=2003368 RepID=UPI0035197AA4